MRPIAPFLALAAAVAGLPLASVQAAPPTAKAAAPDALKQESDRLALALTPDSNIEMQVDQFMAALVNQMRTQNEDFMALEEEFPGLIDAVAARTRPIMIKGARSVMPLYRADLSQFYQANLTLADARAAADFFSSADGQAFIRSATGAVDYKRSAGAVMREEEASAADVEADKRAAARKFSNEISPEMRTRLMAFFQTPAGLRIIALGRSKSAIDRKWFNYSRPEDEKAIELATIEAMLEHIAKTDPKTAAAMRKEMIKNGDLPPP